MAQYELSLRDYWRIIRKRRWVIITIFSLIFIGTFIYSSLQPRIYQAVATVHYKEQRLLATLLTELIQYPVGDVMQSQALLIKSWSVAEIAGKDLGWVRADMPVEQANQTISSIQSSVDTKVIQDTDSINIIVTNKDPNKASEIANAIAIAYQQYNLIDKSKQATNLRQTVENRLSQTMTELEQSERALQRFKEQNPDVIGAAIPAYNRYESLKKEEETLLRKYTPKYPDVIKVRSEIETLEKELSKYPAKEITLSQLTRNIQINSLLYSDRKQQFENAKIAEGEKTSDITISNLSLLPTTPIKPHTATNQIIGVILGIIISFSLAFIIEHLDTSIGTIEEIELLLKLPVLGVIPFLSSDTARPREKPSKKDILTFLSDAISDSFTILFGGRGKGTSESATRERSRVVTEKVASDREGVTAQLIWNFSPTSPLFEAYRTLRTNLLQSRPPEAEQKLLNNTPENNKRVILITSTGPQEGKTITAANLAITMALQGTLTLLVDMDMRKPFIHKSFGLERENGLSDVLIGIKKTDECLHNITDVLVGGTNFDAIMNTPGIDNLHILTAGTSVPNPSELLSRGTDRLLDELRSRYHYIICDCPPVLPVADVLIVGPKVDVVALVYRAGRTAKGALVRAKEQTLSARINLKGIILNYVSPEIEVSPTYYYHYYKHYDTERTKT
ncbi:MAG: AAA family ATPase [Planctomycetota bacterium]|nr:AAA family ATPase [Planctomycetota bacterium]